MKLASTILDKLRPLFEEGARFARLHPIFQAADTFFFTAPLKTANAP